MLTFKMRFYVHKTPDGLYHVQNAIGHLVGQHHVHTEQSFSDWSKQVEKDEIKMLDNGPCDCGLGPGDVREYDGKT